MKKVTQSLIALIAMSTLSMAEWYPAYGPDSYQASSSAANVEGVTRKGFRLGIGIGGANTSVDNIFYNYDYDETGFATSFEIGYAPNNQVSINYFNNVNWAEYSSSTVDGASGMTAVTLNYYLDNAVNTAYLVGGVGGAVLDREADIAGLIGIGYAIDKVEIEFDAIFGQYKDKDMTQFFLTVSYMFY
jgi:hypothetical protein